MERAPPQEPDIGIAPARAVQATARYKRILNPEDVDLCVDHACGEATVTYRWPAGAGPPPHGAGDAGTGRAKRVINRLGRRSRGVRDHHVLSSSEADREERVMLAVTRLAAEAINAATAAKGMAETGGLRISVDATTDQGATLTSAIVTQPAEGDQVITSETGPQVFLEPEAALYLTDKVLDVEQDADGQRYLALHGRV